MVAIRAMDKVATVATRAMDSRVAMVATRLTVATKAMAVSLIRVMVNKATVPNRDTANKVMASRRVMGSKATTVATRAMDSKEATVETKAMANKTTMSSLGMASIRAPNTNNS